MSKKREISKSKREFLRQKSKEKALTIKDIPIARGR